MSERILITLEIPANAADARVVKVVKAAEREAIDTTIADANLAMRELRELVETLRQRVDAGQGAEIATVLGTIAEGLAGFDKELQTLFASI